MKKLTEEELHEKLTALAERRREVKNQMDTLDEELAGVNAELMEMLEYHKQDRVKCDGVTVGIVRSTMSSWDQDFLQSVLTKKQWDSITERVVDDDLFSAALDREEIDEEVAEKALVVTDKKPYVQVWWRG